MQTIKKTENKLKKEKSKDETSTRRSQDEKLKKTAINISTPRNFLQKSSTADIYGHKNTSNVQSVKAPKKTSSTTYKSSNVSPMKDLLKSSPSSISQLSRSSDRNIQKKVESKVLHSARQTPKKANLPLTNVTVNSPIAKRKLNLDRENTGIKRTDQLNLERDKTVFTQEVPTKSEKYVAEKVEKVGLERQRTKTRTLAEDEVKVLTSDMVDNNAEMMNLSRKLVAKPKAFYVDLDGENSKIKTDKSSEDEISYEDDFESYESDFESYHSETNDQSSGCDGNYDHVDGDDHNSGDGDKGRVDDSMESNKEIRDEERMLDSGSYDLRDRSAKTKPLVMENILEDTEDVTDTRVSLTDEGFQEMSSSAVSSLKTVHVDVLDRPIFIDFSKSKDRKRKRRVFERLRQRANDLLNMITLHEMSYSLFEMKPISYDLYMATFGRKNYTQTSAQTFDDGVSEEIQTEEISCNHMWTQNPVKFSKSDIYMYKDVYNRKYSINTVDYLTKFTFLTQNKCEDLIDEKIESDENYKLNPLRIYFEQKDGVGSCEMLPYDNYNSRLTKYDFNTEKLRKFLKKFESRISNVLSFNAGSTELIDSIRSTKFSFSKGYTSLSNREICEEKFTFLKTTKITQVYFSKSKSNLVVTCHEKMQNKCIICLWDTNMAKREPVKVLKAIDNVIIGRFHGNTDGLFVAALEDGSIHLWHLCEQATLYDGVAIDDKDKHFVEVPSEILSESERDREWNIKNSHIGIDQNLIHCALQACAYTSSAYNMANGDGTDRIVGLELRILGSVSEDGGRKVVGQVASLQRIGILTIWSVIQEKSKYISIDIGKAYWSKIKLEKSLTIRLIDHIDMPFEENSNTANFNLTSAKRRLTCRKQEKNIPRRDVSRPKSANSSDLDFDIDRPGSDASTKSKKSTKILPLEKNNFKIWQIGIVCNDLNIMKLDNMDNYLIAKNCGEVLCCKRTLGAVKVQKFSVANTSSVTSLEVSPHGLPYFIAATDCGTLNLCSLIENRVLLTLDCRNVVKDTTEKCQSDHKGRYIASVSVRTQIGLTGIASRITVASLLWSPVNPCCIFALLQDGVVVAWDLTSSDIYGKQASEHARALVAGDNELALLTQDGEVQIHRLANEHRVNEYFEIFKKYVALL